MENKKETPEETIERLFKLYSEYSGGMAYKNIEQLIELSGSEGTKNLIISIAKDYHSERLKLSLPSEEEWKIKAIEGWEKHPLNRSDYNGINPSAFVLGWQSCKEYILNLLTKGDNK
jgi:hypothetical protein